MWLLSKLLRLIPGVGSLLDWVGNTALKLYSAKLSADGAHEAKIADLAAREIDLEGKEAALNLQAKAQIRGRWWAPENLFGYIAVTYWAKVITLDFVLASLLRDFGLGDPQWTTGSLKGATATAMAQIMMFWLGARGVQNVASIVAGAFGKRG